MQKVCTVCSVAKPFSAYARRAASADGLAPLCKECKCAAAREKYRTDPGIRAVAMMRAKINQKKRFLADPVYQRAFNLWGSSKRRTRMVPWAKITDFLQVCEEALAAGADCDIDHIIPLNHPLICGLHVANNVRVLSKKQNRLAWELAKRADYLDLLEKVLLSMDDNR
jgi:hypothetical protein